MLLPLLLALCHQYWSGHQPDAAWQLAFAPAAADACQMLCPHAQPLEVLLVLSHSPWLSAVQLVLQVLMAVAVPLAVSLLLLPLL